MRNSGSEGLVHTGSTVSQTPFQETHEAINSLCHSVSTGQGTGVYITHRTGFPMGQVPSMQEPRQFSFFSKKLIYFLFGCAGSLLLHVGFL